jgi:hypothetical protein
MMEGHPRRVPFIVSTLPSPEEEMRSPVPKTYRWLEVCAGLLLFAATAAVVVWQNAHLAVIWDLSYTLENSYRIALGEIPYRDFPFAHAPLTFLMQAAIIKLTGRVFWHTTAYGAVAGGLGTLLTWRILRNTLREAKHARLLAFMLSVPLIPLGIYAIFPHPFYDPDCTLAILIGVLLLQRLELKPSSKSRPILAGALLVIPLFVKQNTGLLFMLSAIGLILAVAVWEKLQHRAIRRYGLIVLSAALTFTVAVLLIHFTAGLKNYWHWTIQFAAARRTPARGEMLGIYTDKMTFVWLGFVVAGVWLMIFVRPRSRLLTILSALLISAPFIWPVIYLLRDSDPSERAERLINVWPVVIISAFVISIITIKKRAGISRVLPFILIAAINGCFMSQQLWGSTYAIWPLLMILVATSLSTLFSFRSEAGLGPPIDQRTSEPPKPTRELFVFVSTSVIVVALSIAGAFYVHSHERLSYANLDDGALKRSTLPVLKGLSTRGEWIPQFEELVRYADQKIPRDEGILLLPGEDPFYFTTGRRPQFPVLLFDHTVNPYSPQQILQLCRERNIKWLVVKQDLQDEDDGVNQEEEQITAALEEDFEQIDSLGNYEVYHRIDPNAKKDDDDDDDDSK